MQMIENSKAPNAQEKPGRGRPKTSEPDLVRVNAQVPFDEHKKLKVYCAKTGKTITDVIRKMITDLPD